MSRTCVKQASNYATFKELVIETAWFTRETLSVVSTELFRSQVWLISMTVNPTFQSSHKKYMGVHAYKTDLTSVMCVELLHILFMCLLQAPYIQNHKVFLWMNVCSHLASLYCSPSGKSTLLNALISCEAMPVNNVPETARIVKIIHDPSSTLQAAGAGLAQTTLAAHSQPVLQDGNEMVVGVAAVRARLSQLNCLARGAPPSSPHPATEAVADNAVLQLTVPLTALQVGQAHVFRPFICPAMLPTNVTVRTSEKKSKEFGESLTFLAEFAGKFRIFV